MPANDSTGLRIFLAMLATSIVAAASRAQPATEPAAMKTGTFQQNFIESSPLSSLETQTARYRLKPEPIHRYQIADHPFTIDVPESAPEKPFGVMVWINAGDNGSPPRQLSEVFEKYHLIGISAADSGNDIGIGVRIGLAVDAVHNLRKLYPLDDSRIYAGGVSGGGKIAGMVATIYPDVFSGALCVVGVTYFREIPASPNPGKVWPPSFGRPGALLFDRARRDGRFVLMTGTNDMNRDAIKDTYIQGFQKDRFQHVSYVEIPDQGHSMPRDMSWINQAIEFLDSSVSAKQNASVTPATKPAAARQSTTSLAVDAETAPNQLLSLAETYQNARLYAQASERLEKIIKDYPTSKAAVSARKMLAQIKASQSK